MKNVYSVEFEEEVPKEMVRKIMKEIENDEDLVENCAFFIETGNSEDEIRIAKEAYAEMMALNNVLLEKYGFEIDLCTEAVMNRVCYGDDMRSCQPIVLEDYRINENGDAIKFKLVFWVSGDDALEGFVKRIKGRSFKIGVVR